MSAGPAFPPTWNLAAPTPSGERIAVATALSNAPTPDAAMIPPTFTALVSSITYTASDI